MKIQEPTRLRAARYALLGRPVAYRLTGRHGSLVFRAGQRSFVGDSRFLLTEGDPPAIVIEP